MLPNWSKLRRSLIRKADGWRIRSRTLGESKLGSVKFKYVQMFSFIYFIFILARYELRSPKRCEHLWLCRLCHYVFIFFMYLRIRKSRWFFKMSLDERMYLSSHCSSQRTRHSCRHGGTVINLCLDHPRVVIRLVTNSFNFFSFVQLLLYFTYLQINPLAYF